MGKNKSSTQFIKKKHCKFKLHLWVVVGKNNNVVYKKCIFCGSRKIESTEFTQFTSIDFDFIYNGNTKQ
jgi:predicted nucleic acid-binding Zn finger protein